MILRRLLPACLLISLPLWAQTPGAPSPLERQQQQEKAEHLLAQAAELRAAADQTLADEKAACYQRLLVNSCLAQADAKHLKTAQEARKLEVSGRAIKRTLRSQENAEKAAAIQAERAAMRKDSERLRPTTNSKTSHPASADEEIKRLREQDQAKQLKAQQTADQHQAQRDQEAVQRRTEAVNQSAAAANARSTFSQRQAAAMQDVERTFRTTPAGSPR